IEFQHIDAWLTQKAELPFLGMFFDKFGEICFSDASGFRYSGNLKLSARRCDIRIEPGPRCCHEIYRNRLAGVFSLEGCYVALDASNELLVGRTVVAAA